MSSGANPFEVLGLPPTASVSQVKAAYRRKSRQLHPDVGGDEAAFRALTQAAEEAGAYASGARPNPYLAPPKVEVYDRHRYSPPPPPNPWRHSGGLFWILPVLAGIFMISSSMGSYFLPVFVCGCVVLAAAVLLVRWRRTRRS